MPADRVLRSGSLGKGVAEQRLRDALASGEVAPGQRLIEAELAERYGVTRHSARLALDALAGEGLVERIANRGVRVRTVSTAEAVAIMECRMALDGLLSRRAAEAATGDHLVQLMANRARMGQAVGDQEYAKYSELIQRHHALVRKAARHSVAAALVERLQAQIVRHQFQLSLRPQRAQQSLAELEEVVDAIVARDPDRAEQAARLHLQGVIAAVLAESVER